MEVLTIEELRVRRLEQRMNELAATVATYIAESEPTEESSNG